MALFGKKRATTCKFCLSPDCDAGEAMLRERAGYRAVAERLDLSVACVGRHVLNHMRDDGDAEPNEGTRNLIDSTERALHRCERRGDSAGVMNALKLLSTLQQRSRILAAASSPSQRAAETEVLNQQPRDAAWLVERLNEIYGLRGSHWDARLKEREADAQKTPDERLVASLDELVDRTYDSRPKIVASAILLASLLRDEPLDPETKNEVKRLLLAPEGIDLDDVTKNG